MPIDNIHDKFFKESFSRKDITAALLEQVLPSELVERLDLAALELANGSYVDEVLQEHFADLLFDCPYQGQGQTTVQIALLLEHKSYREKYPHWQLLRYLLNGWEGDRKQKRPPKIRIPIVIYHGTARWQYQPMIDYFAEVQPPLPQYIPEFQYHLVDLSVLSDSQIASFKSRFLETVLLLLKHRQNERFLLASGDRLFYWLTEYVDTRDGENFLRTTLVYLASVTDISKHTLIEQLFLNTPIATKAMTVLDYWIETGIEKGMKQGLQKGLEQGLQQGLQKGLEQGLEQGRAEAVADVIRNAYQASNGRVDVDFLAMLIGYTPAQVIEIVESIRREQA
ncbi:Rpn family recombination-promoting nuclease/putative transposase [Spirosoma aerolatum]|uniref:Rpn family recombination-promoting nuclease/putative transposase n=1 Tax=Spirosoma aerolatum TaxID=1211326 RepID=UPI0009AEC368|nr:Rpn family recombination-promoting nuclease/putative transposase [Spirosoma aerolatum]